MSTSVSPIVPWMFECFVPGHEGASAAKLHESLGKYALHPDDLVCAPLPGTCPVLPGPAVCVAVQAHAPGTEPELGWGRAWMRRVDEWVQAGELGSLVLIAGADMQRGMCQTIGLCRQGGRIARIDRYAGGNYTRRKLEAGALDVERVRVEAEAYRLALDTGMSGNSSPRRRF